MIVTVTLNPALDKSITVPSFAVNCVNRAEEVRLDPGGKGINVSKTVFALGGKTLALGILGGAAGGYIKSSLDNMGLENDFVFSPHATRTNLKIQDPVSGTTTDVNEAGAPADARTLQQIWKMIENYVNQGDVVIFAGKNPPQTPDGLLAEWTRKLHRMGVKVAVDTEGAALLPALRERPEIIKPNLQELAQLLGCGELTAEQVAEAAGMLSKSGVALAVISMGEDGAVFAGNGRVIRGYAPQVKAVSTVGAGDAMMAALAMGMEQGAALEDIARHALAVASAAVLQSGTAAVDPKTVEQLLDQVRLEQV